MEAQDTTHIGWDRRRALKMALGSAVLSAALVAPTKPAQAQTAGDIDTLNLVLNLEYLLAQFLSAATGEVVPADRLTGNGVAGTLPVAGRAVTFSATIRPIVREMAGDNRAHLLPLRVVIGALAVRQPLIDISANATAPFSVVMQRAGIVTAGTAFDPYVSEDNFLLALFYLKSVSVAAYRGLAATISNRVVVQNFTGLLGAEAIHAATLRSLLYTRAATTPRFRTSCDAIAAFQRSLNGGQVFQGIAPLSRSFPGGAAPVQVANFAPTLAAGEVGGLSAGQVLNQLYLTNAAATVGGFFPEGVNGTIRTSASA